MKGKVEYPAKKLTIVGGGIIGYLEAYYAYLIAKKQGQRIRVTIHEKNSSIKDTTTAHLVPNLSPYELFVVPKGKDLIKQLGRAFNETDGLRVDDVDGINDSEVTKNFIRAVEAFGNDEEGYKARTETLLELGKLSMNLWQQISDEGDEELKDILKRSNFNPCGELKSDVFELHKGYRIDLVFRVPNAINRANSIIKDYSNLGYKYCKTLTPQEVMKLDPFLSDFCRTHSTCEVDGTLSWNNDAVAFWRPGGCIDTQMFLPLFHDYLERVMGEYQNSDGQMKPCFQMHKDRKVKKVKFDEDANNITALRFFGHSTFKANSHQYDDSQYVFCPGEAVGTLKSLGFSEPEYARFAGASLMLSIDIPEGQLERFAKLKHHMSVFQNGVSSAWQARCIGKQLFVGIAGTKAFYGDVEPHKNHEFAVDRNLVQLNMLNEILPEVISLAFGRPTLGEQLTADDMDELEAYGIAVRWAGTRAVAYDGVPTVSKVYNSRGEVTNARTTTGLGSGGASFGPATVCVSNNSMFVPKDLAEKMRTYGSSARKGFQ